MTYAIAIALLSIVPVGGDVTRESCDLIELNHYFDEHARLVFDQVIFYDWDGKRYQVRAWRLVKQEGQVPQRDWANNGYSAMWHDGEELRRMFSRSIRETWTQQGGEGDPELNEREWLPKERRKELRCVRWDKPSGAIRPSPIPVAAPDLP
jgi:hypothetical protein